MNGFTKRRKIAVLSVLALLVVAGSAFAYFTTTGSGTGTATVGTSSAVTLNGTIATTLYPGTTSPVSFTVDNPSSGSQRVATIHLASVTADGTHSTCAVADFTMPDVTVNQVFAHGTGETVTATGTLTMANTGISQDACQGATLTLNLTSS
ncbi:MAG TPA: hypothetical protein VG165_08260 [Solirubrobacteraceae bacterium]|jgi:hypothetical protein|nr:hypothetical protein [Solirubrobacteraceae bacterium]